MNKILFTLFCVLPFWGFSQSNYKAAFITVNNGDVTSGYIDYREWVKNPVSIQFKNNIADPNSRTYSAPDLKAFVINGLETYVTYVGRISMNHTRFPDLSNGVDSSSSQATVFFKQLAKGNFVDLYSYTDSLKERYFVQEKQGKPVELLYQNYYADETHRQTKKLKSFTGYLIYLAGKYQPNNAELISSIEHSDYNSNIIKLVNKINGDEVSGINNSTSSSARYYVGLAYNRNKFTFHLPFAGNAVVNKSAPVLNFGIDILPNKNVQKFFVRTDVSLSYSSIKYQHDFDAFDVVDGIPYNTGNYEYKYATSLLSATITPQIGWSFYNTDAFKLYIDAGASILLLQYGGQKLERIPENGGAPSTITSYGFGSARVGFPVQLGAVFNKRYEVFVSYGHYSSFKPTEEKNYYLNYNPISLGVHWLLY